MYTGYTQQQAYSRPAQFGREPEPARPMLAGHIVTQTMLDDARLAKMQGKRVAIATPGLAADSLPADACDNCGGLGVLVLQVVEAGPAKGSVQGSGGEFGGGLLAFGIAVLVFFGIGAGRMSRERDERD
jgi:hypothetical protein